MNKIKQSIENIKQRKKEATLEKKIQKQKEKERIRIHNELLEKEKIRVKEDKIAPEDSFISLQHIQKIYPNHVQAVYDFNLEIKPKEFIVLVGPSGCGKSTTLRMIAGLEDITGGDLYIDKVYSNFIEPKDRNIAMVFQNYALYPHLSVYDNMAFSLKIQKLPAEEIRKRIMNAAEILQLKEYLRRKPNALSGGQCQRVALGRAIVRNSNLFLMDEPLSNLDAKLRVSTRCEIIKLHEQLGATTIYVTHDQTEAMTMATRIVVMNGGYIQQIGTPQEIYDKPANTFVASFIGSPSMNLIKAIVEDNTIKFENGFEIKLTPEERQAFKDFYLKGLEEAKQEFEVVDANPEKLKLKEELQNCSDKKRIEEIDERITVIEKADNRRIELIKTIEAYKQGLENRSKEIVFGIRPSDIYDNSEVPSRVRASNEIVIEPRICELMGNSYYVHSDFCGIELVSELPAYKQAANKNKIAIVFDLNKCHIFDKETSKIIF